MMIKTQMYQNFFFSDFYIIQNKKIFISQKLIVHRGIKIHVAVKGAVKVYKKFFKFYV